MQAVECNRELDWLHFYELYEDSPKVRFLKCLNSTWQHWWQSIVCPLTIACVLTNLSSSTSTTSSCLLYTGNPYRAVAIFPTSALVTRLWTWHFFFSKKNGSLNVILTIRWECYIEAQYRYLFDNNSRINSSWRQNRPNKALNRAKNIWNWDTQINGREGQGLAGRGSAGGFFIYVRSDRS